MVVEHHLDTGEDCGGAGLELAQTVGDLPEGRDTGAAQTDRGNAGGN